VRISGFSFVRNATKLYYPIREAVASILPLVDEFVVAVGDNDHDDQTVAELEALNSPKVRLIHTTWDLETYPRGTENAHQTDIALKACTGDWLFYLQADEVVHERYLPVIEARCRELLPDQEVEGLLFHYRHFWGDYQHYVDQHGWYPNEIRIVRNHPDIHSWESAQSFRRVPAFDGKTYRGHPGAQKLKVAPVEAYIYHYGWVRPPQRMRAKSKALDSVHHGVAQTEQRYRQENIQRFDYGPLGRLRQFKGTHPAVMQERIAAMDWQDDLRYDKGPFPKRPTPFKHEIWKNRALSWVERNLNGGKQIFTFRNYERLKR